MFIRAEKANSVCSSQEESLVRGRPRQQKLLKAPEKKAGEAGFSNAAGTVQEVRGRLLREHPGPWAGCGQRPAFLRRI